MKTFSSVILLVMLLFGSPTVSNDEQQPAIILAPSMHQLEPLLEYDVMQWLDINRPAATHIYAVMSNADNQYGVFVSLAGIDVSTPPPYDWQLEEGNVIWTGTLKRVAGELQLFTPGGHQANHTVYKLASPTLSAFLGGPGGGPEIAFPWQAGTKMQYGTRGIHGGGFNFGIGLDFISGDDMGNDAAPPVIYASANGTIVNVCSDAFSTAVQLVEGENTFAYFHLENNASLTQGAVYTKGQPIGTLRYGSFNLDMSEPCGWAEQQPNHYHLHWVVEDNNAGNFQAEGWILKSSDGKWHRGSETISINQWLLGGGGSGSLTDDPGSKPNSTLVIIAGQSSMGGGSSIWDYFLIAMNTLYGTVKGWYVANFQPANSENEKMWVLTANMFNTIIKDANIYLVNDTINIMPLFYAYSAMLALEAIKWGATIIISIVAFIRG